MDNNILLNNGKNFLKAGASLIIYDLSKSMLHESSRNALESLVKDIRKIRTNIKDRRAINQLNS